MDDLDLEYLIAKSVDQAVAARVAAAEKRLAFVEENLGVSASSTSSAEEISAPMMVGRSILTGDIGGTVKKPNRISSMRPSSTLVESNSDSTSTFAERVAGLESKVMEFEDTKDERRQVTKYNLPESTFTLMITEKPLSVPFVFAVCATSLSLTCLWLTLAESIAKSTRNNALGIPFGVSRTVTAAQFCGIILGVLFEDEIPEALQLIAHGNMGGQVAGRRGSFQRRRPSLMVNGTDIVSRRRIILSSMLRIAVGYTFLAALFINIAQGEDVINIFYDVLALGFVESIDDHSFALAKRGFFGKTMLIATSKQIHLDITGERGMSSGNWVHRFARIFYFCNALAMLSGLVVITVNQYNGQYRCESLTVNFDEEIWDAAHVGDDESTKETLLLYSHFSGTYVENGTADGYPKYTEQNKRDNRNFVNTIGAEIRYCRELGAWVFSHPNIKTSRNAEEENECSWLMRSPETLTFDIEYAASFAWNVWLGEIESSNGLSISCNECVDRSDCSYHGVCSNRQCQCEETHFGYQCQLGVPCLSLATEKRGCCGWQPDEPILLVNNTQEVGKFDMVYNRPIYLQTNMTGMPLDLRKFDIVPESSFSEKKGGSLDFADWDDFFGSSSVHDGLDDLLEEGYSIIMSFTGNRWYATMIPLNQTIANWFHYDYHAFWATALSEDRTFIISDITLASYPVAVDWFEMRRRVNYKLRKDVDFAYGPIGVLVPLIEYEGSGWFHCHQGSPTGSPTHSSAPTVSYIPSMAPPPTSSPTLSSYPSQVPPSVAPSSSLSPTETCSWIDIAIVYDDYPSDTSWELRRVVGGDVDNVLVKSFAAADGDGDDDTSVKYICLIEGEYEFIIVDTFSDGICCENGVGHYNVTSNGTLIGEGGEFGESETTLFSIPFVPPF